MNREFAVMLTVVASFSGGFARGDSFGDGGNSFVIPFIKIGVPGNVADTTGDPNPSGSVGYEYRIGTFEISESMVDKANSQSAADGKPLSIARLAHRGPSRPITEISWVDAARFVNWLNTSQGHAPAYKFDGAGNFQLWSSSDAGYNANNLYRNNLAFYFLPSSDEWYKAAYFDPVAGVYYDYPTGSNSQPDGIDSVSDTVFEAVFYEGASAGPKDITNVGIASPFGTFGQGGNVWELLETAADLHNTAATESRMNRGLGWTGTGFQNVGMLSTKFVQAGFDVPYFDAGFRVASRVPEPSLIALLSTAVLLLHSRYRKLG